MEQRRPLHRSPSNISTAAAAPFKRLFGSVASARSQSRGQAQGATRAQEQRPDRGAVQIIKDISDLNEPRWDVWGGATRSGVSFDGGPHRGTVNVGWLVGTPSASHGVQREQQPPGHHIDIYEHSQAQPPSHLNVKDSPASAVVIVDRVVAAATGQTPGISLEAGNSKAPGADLDSSASSERWLQQQPSYMNLWDGSTSKSNKSTNTSSMVSLSGGRPPSKQGYSLKRSKSRFKHLQQHPLQHQPQSSEDETNMYSLRRSKSVCDIPELSLVPIASEADEVASVNSGARNSLRNRAAAAARSKVVRNRTILGSFPLFYKLSQSLSSLNTNSRGNTIDNRGRLNGGDFNDCPAFVEDPFER